MQSRILRELKPEAWELLIGCTMADQLSCALMSNGYDSLIRPQFKHDTLTQPEVIMSGQTPGLCGEPFPQPTIAFTTQLMNHPGLKADNKDPGTFPGNTVLVLIHAELPKAQRPLAARAGSAVWMCSEASDGFDVCCMQSCWVSSVVPRDLHHAIRWQQQVFLYIVVIQLPTVPAIFEPNFKRIYGIPDWTHLTWVCSWPGWIFAFVSSPLMRKPIF